MQQSIRHHIVAALFLALPMTAAQVLQPAAAQARFPAAAPIDSLQVNADNTAAGATLEITLRGMPAGRARVQFDGTGIDVPLQETAPGVYSGRYVIKPTDRLDPGRQVRASLTAGRRVFISSFVFPSGYNVAGELRSSNAPSAPAAQSPVQAQALRIDRLFAAPVTRLEPGTQLRFELTGASGASASLELPGILGDIPMREAQPGVYVGNYTLRQQDRLAAGPVVATLRSGQQWVRTQASLQSLTDSVPPVIGNLVPREGERLARAGVTLISGTLDDPGGSGVDPASVRISMGGRDITGETQVTPQHFTWRGNLSPGQHAVLVTARDAAGNEARQEWNFDVGSAMGAPAGGGLSGSPLPLQVISPLANAAIDGSQVVLHGRTAPGAQVRVNVDAIAPAEGSRLTVARPVTQQTVLADADGHFSINFGPQRSVPGTRYEVSIAAQRGSQTTSEKLVLFQRR